MPTALSIYYALLAGPSYRPLCLVPFSWGDREARTCSHLVGEITITKEKERKMQSVPVVFLGDSTGSQISKEMYTRKDAMGTTFMICVLKDTPLLKHTTSFVERSLNGT